MLLNPNCSELVSYLGPRTKKEVIEAIKKINAQDNLQVVYTIDRIDPEPIWLIIPIPQGKEEEVIKVSFRKEARLDIDLEKLLSFYSPISEQVKDIIEDYRNDDDDSFKY